RYSMSALRSWSTTVASRARKRKQEPPMKSPRCAIREMSIRIRGDLEIMGGVGPMAEWTLASVEDALRRPASGNGDWFTILDDLDAATVRPRSYRARWQ